MVERRIWRAEKGRIKGITHGRGWRLSRRNTREPITLLTGDKEEEEKKEVNCVWKRKEQMCQFIKNRSGELVRDRKEMWSRRGEYFDELLNFIDDKEPELSRTTKGGTGVRRMREIVSISEKR